MAVEGELAQSTECSPPSIQRGSREPGEGERSSRGLLVCAVGGSRRRKQEEEGAASSCWLLLLSATVLCSGSCWERGEMTYDANLLNLLSSTLNKIFISY